MPPTGLAIDIRTQIRSIIDLPPLPQNAQRLLQQLSNEDIDTRQLVELIESSSTIAARTVALASSAYFAHPVPVRSVQDPVVRVLGLNLTKNLITSAVVNAALEPSLCPGSQPERYWRDGLLATLFARGFAQLTRGEHREDADLTYLCGLLHNIDVAVLTHVAPNR